MARLLELLVELPLCQLGETSLELLLQTAQLDTLVVVLAEEYRSLDFLAGAVADERVRFADPGAERQDSVSNGLAQARTLASGCCGAR